MGRVWKFGENLNTDEIIPGRYNITTDLRELAEHVFCEIKPDYSKNVATGDIMVAARIWLWISREHAPLAIRHLEPNGYSPSFARISTAMPSTSACRS